jgi:uncharacterized protein (TIGR03437 family)
MQRESRTIFAKAAVLLGAIPVLVWAHSFGPDTGFSGVPNENGTCVACHNGTLNSFSGSVKVTFPGGQTYTPGQKQHLVVTVADPATTQRAWGFQLTARLASNTATMAGSFASTDANTTVMCASANLGSQSELKSGGSQACPSSQPLAYIEHSLAGYSGSVGRTGSYTYEFDWTPPATNSGDLVVYVSGNAANGDRQNTGDHIYNTNFTLKAAAASGNTPTITSVSGSAGGQSGVFPGAFVSVYGTNLATTTSTWDKAVVNGALPTTLDGVSVSVGGKPAYISYVSPTQVNLVVPPDAGLGSTSVIVTSANVTSAAFSTTSQQYGPAFFPIDKYPVATRQDFTLALKNGAISGVTTVAAKPGDVLILWGTGFGPTNPTPPAGTQVPSDKVYNTATLPTVTINNVPAQVFGAALAPGFAALYQVAIQVPSSLADGDWPIVASISGVQSPGNLVLTVQR